MTLRVLLSVGLFAAPAHAFGCVDLPSLRSSTVLASFDASKLTGTWYENAYTDPGQVGASCQTINNTLTSDGLIVQHFSTRYGIIPFAQTYDYEPVGNATSAVYKKYLTGAKLLLQLPTVVVDVTEGAGGTYTQMIEYTCKPILGVASAQELRFLSRERTIAASALAAMKQTAVAAGVPSSTVNSVKDVDYSKCS